MGGIRLRGRRPSLPPRGGRRGPGPGPALESGTLAALSSSQRATAALIAGPDSDERAPLGLAGSSRVGRAASGWRPRPSRGLGLQVRAGAGCGCGPAPGAGSGPVDAAGGVRVAEPLRRWQPECGSGVPGAWIHLTRRRDAQAPAADQWAGLAGTGGRDALEAGRAGPSPRPRHCVSPGFELASRPRAEVQAGRARPGALSMFQVAASGLTRIRRDRATRSASRSP